MKITDVSIPKEFNENGVEDINMHRLGNVVLIAGKNGSGKTRILSKIQFALGSKPSLTQINTNKHNYTTYQQAISHQKKQIIAHEYAISNGNLSNEQINNIKSNIETCNKTILQQSLVVDQANRILNWNYINTDVQSESYAVIPFVPKNHPLSDPSSFNKKIILENAAKVSHVGVNNLHIGALSKIQIIQDRWFHATHQETTISQDEKAKAISEYELLKNMIMIFLNVEIGRNIDGEATLFGFSLGMANLSDGQKILIQLCIAIYSQEPTLKDLILFLDEPENHLHPSVMIETLDRLLKCVPNGQIWISTHSVPLLAHFDPSFIWYVEDNKISYAGNIPEKVLSSLLGDETEIAKLQDFINLPMQYALNRYAYECLFQPISVTTDKNDPQTLQINRELEEIVKTEKIKILDYGEGKGRLLSNLYESFNYDLMSMDNKFNYVAYDKFPSDKKACETVINSVYSNSESHYFNEMQILLSKHDENSFDVVIMCNVLHEVDPNEWLMLFKSGGLITKLLKDNGVLLIIEDTQMPIGEKAYQKGFIVLDTPQIKELFNIKNADSKDGFTFSDARGDGRLKAHRIPKKFLSNITSETKIKSLNSLREIAQQKILKIRSEEQSYKNGKIHAFWVQQFANTSLALSELE